MQTGTDKHQPGHRSWSEEASEADVADNLAQECPNTPAAGEEDYQCQSCQARPTAISKHNKPMDSQPM